MTMLALTLISTIGKEFSMTYKTYISSNGSSGTTGNVLVPTLKVHVFKCKSSVDRLNWINFIENALRFTNKNHTTGGVGPQSQSVSPGVTPMTNSEIIAVK